MNLEQAYNILERYYLCLYDILNDSNCEGFDISDVLDKISLEKIISKRYGLDSDDVAFLRELLSDGDLGKEVSDAVRYILNENV